MLTISGRYNANTKTLRLNTAVDGFAKGADVKVRPADGLPLEDMDALDRLTCDFQVQRSKKGGANAAVYDVLAVLATT